MSGLIMPLSKYCTMEWQKALKMCVIRLWNCKRNILNNVWSISISSAVYFVVGGRAGGACVFKYDRTEVLRAPSLTWLGFKLMTSRSWQYISCHWDTCSNYLAISSNSWPPDHDDISCHWDACCNHSAISDWKAGHMVQVYNWTDLHLLSFWFVNNAR